MQVLDDLIENKVGINNYSEAIRYMIGVYSKQLSEENSIVNQRKINAMSKNVDRLVEMVAGSFHEQGIKAIEQSTETYVYKDAKKMVEENIQRAFDSSSSKKLRSFCLRQRKRFSYSDQIVVVAEPFSRSKEQTLPF